MAGDQERFENLLQTLMSPDNTTRAQIEETYENIQITEKLTYLVRAIRSSENAIEVRTLAAVLLRRLFTSNFEDWWPQVPPDLQRGVKEEILKAIQEELTPPIKRKVCDATAELARNLIDESNSMTWPEILKFMFDCANSSDASLRESALHIIGVVPGIFGNQQTHYLEVIKQMLGQSLHDQANTNVWFEAVRATSAFLTANEKEQAVIHQFRDLLPGIIQAVAESIEAQDDDSLLKCLIDLAERVPKFLRPQVENVMTLCLKVLSDVNLPDNWRQLGLEVIVTLSETAPATVRKFNKFVTHLSHDRLYMAASINGEGRTQENPGKEPPTHEKLLASFLTYPHLLNLRLKLKLTEVDYVKNRGCLCSRPDVGVHVPHMSEVVDRWSLASISASCVILVPQVLAMMVDLEEDPEWSLQDEVEDDDEVSNAVTGESALDRLACALGGKTILPHIIANIPPMLQNSDWRFRHAALMAVSACGEGCHQQMETVLDSVLDVVLPFLKDSHPRVRYAACNAIGQMSTDFGPTFQKKFHAKILPDLLQILDDNDNPRVQAHGAAALVNFSEDCPKSILILYLDTIIMKLEQALNSKFKELLEKGTKMVLEQVVTTLASVADTTEEKFIQYYDRFMPCLKYIFQNANNDHLKLLRGKTIECISLIGLAVGKDKFVQDCSDVMQLLLKTQTDMSDIPDDDPQISYMISAWARMCKIMGKDFQQYLPLVMGPVLKAASLKPEVALLDSEDLADVEDDPDWQFVTLGDQQSFGIKTAGLEEKSTACQMLVCYAKELKEGFVAYTEEVVTIMVPLLKFYFHEEVRTSAAEILPYLVECAQIRGEQYVGQMWNYICPNLLKAIEVEPELSVLPEHMASLARCIELLGKGCLSSENINQLLQILDKQLKEHFSRQEERQEKRKDEDYDEIVEETLLDEDDEDVYILSKIADVIHSLFGTHKEEFFPMFEQLLPHFVKLLGPDRPWPDKQWGLCIWDDVLEHGGPHSVKYQEFFLQNLLSYICDKQAEVRQAAAYGIGVMAQFGGESYAQTCAECIPRLLSVIQDPESRSVDNANATENAIAAVIKICKYNSSCINVNEILPHWLSWLPVWEDEDEAVHVYNYLCDLVEMNHPLILGENNSNLPRVVQIIAETLNKDGLEKDEKVKTRVLDIVRQIQGNEQMFQACLSILTVEQREALSTALA